jgi:hypothetical protein
VSGLFRRYDAPADFLETANTIGLPCHAQQAVHQQFTRWVMLLQGSMMPPSTKIVMPVV